jgi:hypothetical protein
LSPLVVRSPHRYINVYGFFYGFHFIFLHNTRTFAWG